MWRYERGFRKLTNNPLVLPPVKVENYGAKANILSLQLAPFCTGLLVRGYGYKLSEEYQNKNTWYGPVLRTTFRSSGGDQ